MKPRIRSRVYLRILSLVPSAPPAPPRSSRLPLPPGLGYAVSMSAEETKVEMLRRHVRQGAEHVAKQRALVAQLTADWLPVEEAGALLATFEDLQRQHEAHLAAAERA